MPLKRSGVSRNSVSQRALLAALSGSGITVPSAYIMALRDLCSEGEGHQNLGAMALTGAGATV